MQEDIQAFMERCIRDRAVAPLDPTGPGLSPQQRRSWWEFCCGMVEFLGNLIRDQVTTRDEAQQLSRLQWLSIQATYVFGTSDPALRGEQRRYAEIFRWIDGVFANAVNDSAGVREMCERLRGPDRPIALGVADALRSSEWIRAVSPSRSLLETARRNSADLRGLMLSESGVGAVMSWPTRGDVQRMFDEALVNGRPYLRIVQFPEQFAPRRDPIAGVMACCDMETAFDLAGLSLNARRVAYAKLQGISRKEVPGELNMSEREVQAGWRELNRKEDLVRDALRKKV